MIVILVSIIALVMGSFAGCVSYRLANAKSIINRSQCPKCNKVLGIFNLIPLFSWLFQKGKCGNCKKKISWRYPLIELFFLATFLIIYFLEQKQITLHFALLCLIATIMIIMAIVDIEKYFIPNSLQIILAILAIILLLIDGQKSTLLLNFGAAIFYCAFGLMLFALFYFISNVEALGVDDIKFFAVAGLMLGFAKFLAFILLVGIFGIVFGATWEKLAKDDTFPFAPALCLSAFVAYFISSKFNLVDWLAKALFY